VPGRCRNLLHSVVAYLRSAGPDNGLRDLRSGPNPRVRGTIKRAPPCQSLLHMAIPCFCDRRSVAGIPARDALAPPARSRVPAAGTAIFAAHVTPNHHSSPFLVLTPAPLLEAALRLYPYYDKVNLQR
jgi:hypothetical protein